MAFQPPRLTSGTTITQSPKNVAYTLKCGRTGKCGEAGAALAVAVKKKKFPPAKTAQTLFK